MCGFAMIEVLVSMGIVSLVFLSLLAYQISVLKNTDQSHFQAIAQQQLMNFTEMLRVNADSTYQNKALKLWNRDNKKLLPKGRGDFEFEDNHQCHIDLKWVYRKKQSESVDVFC
jgi:Tfp pilus assembly protein PilV